jgi:hypothetical protein
MIEARFSKENILQTFHTLVVEESQFYFEMI